MRQKNSETNDYGRGDLVRYYVTDPHGMRLEGGIGMITDVFYTDRRDGDMYRVSGQNTTIQMRFDEIAEEVIQNASRIQKKDAEWRTTEGQV